MAKYRIEIDREACIGDQACTNDAPETFEMDGDNIAVVKNPAGDSPEDILRAAQNCPTDAISVYDETGKKIWPEA